MNNERLQAIKEMYYPNSPASLLSVIEGLLAEVERMKCCENCYTRYCDSRSGKCDKWEAM